MVLRPPHKTMIMKHERRKLGQSERRATPCAPPI